MIFVGLLAEDERDLLAGQVHVQAVEVAEHAEHEHVLALARVGHQRAALVLHRHLVHPVTLGDQAREGLGVLRGDLRVGTLGPDALEQDDAARPQFAGVDAPEQHLLVECDREIGLVAAVADGLRADADPVAAGARHAARGRLDLGRDDLDRPHAVAHPGRDRAERLAALLRALARVAHDLDDGLVERDDLLRRGRRAPGPGRHAPRPQFRCSIHRITSAGARARTRARRGRCRTACPRRRPAAPGRRNRCRAGRERPSFPVRRGARRPSPR